MCGANIVGALKPISESEKTVVNEFAKLSLSEATLTRTNSEGISYEPLETNIPY